MESISKRLRVSCARSASRIPINEFTSASSVPLRRAGR
jgi:hypothetical protein